VTTGARILGFALTALLCCAPVSLAGEPVSDRVDLGAPEKVVAAQRDRWEARIAEARAAAVDAHLRHIDAMDAYRFMRHRDRDRGDEKVAILNELRDAETGLREAVAALEALLESARRAGVPPGWMPDSGDVSPPANGAP
jgi:hypothetical protein